MSLLIILLLPILGALLPPLMTRFGRDAAPVTAAALSGSALALLLWSASLSLDGMPLAMSLPWVPALGLEFALRLDSLGFLFALIILGIGLPAPFH